MPRMVEIVEYDSKWEKAFKEEAKRLRMVLGANCEDIEHIGSTAVKKMSAEPTLDILCVVNDIVALDTQAQRDVLATLGYEPYKPEEIIPGQRLFRMKRESPVPDSFLSIDAQQKKKEDEETRPLCNLYVFDRRNKRDINRHLVVRDYLRGHDIDAKGYGADKQRWAQENMEDIDAYYAAKKTYMDALEETALEWQRQQDRTLSYVSMSMCFGTAIGAVVGALVDRTGIGISYGISFGMLAGLTIGLL